MFLGDSIQGESGHVVARRDALLLDVLRNEVVLFLRQIVREILGFQIAYGLFCRVGRFQE